MNATIAKTKARFANYGDAGLLCGADGLPHLIVDGNLQHLGEFAYPGLGFLYVAGWIGHAGRSYVINNKLKDKPLDGEIIIDVPSALNTMFASAAWPVLAFKEARCLVAPLSQRIAEAAAMPAFLTRVPHSGRRERCSKTMTASRSAPAKLTT